MTGPLIAIALKSLIVAAAVLLILKLAQRRSASDRSLIAHLGLAAVLLLPLGGLLLPSLAVTGPDFLAAEPVIESQPVTSDAAVAAPAPMPAPSMAAEAPSFLSGTDLPLLLWALPALILTALTLLAMIRLVLLKSRANVLVEPQWVSALAHAQRRMGFKHGTALLTSDELPSPISWGVVRPVILLNSEAADAHQQAEAVIAHELAHVAHLDWAKLLLARIVVALFWFNPLVWLLAREAHQLREEAADDAVLAAQIVDTDYAQLLVGVARHECRGLLLGAHGVAPAKNSLARRVKRVLDTALERAPGGWRWTSAAAFFAAGMAVPLAALQVVNPAAALAAKQPRVAQASAVPAISSEAAIAPSTEPLTASAEPRAAPALSDMPTRTITPDGAKVLTAPDGTKMVIDPSGRAIMSGPNGTFIAGPDAVAIASIDGKAMATAVANVKKESVVDRAIELRALGVTPAYVESLRQALPGVRLDPGRVSQFKALGVTSEYIRSLRSVGYGRLSPDKIVELRALGISARDVVRVHEEIGRVPSPDEMVRLKATGASIDEFDFDDGS